MGLAAALYTSVGHAGASGYLAIMALFSVAPATMRPTALLLNIAVASLVTFRFARAGQIRSEEHTSELQSLMRISYAAFCLKKKKTHTFTHITHIPYTTAKRQ